jgi:hypothetical protein
LLRAMCRAYWLRKYAGWSGRAFGRMPQARP